MYHTGVLRHFERNPAEAERCASELIEISTHQNFSTWLPGGAILHGWARSAYGDTAEGISWIEHGISDYRATGRILDTPSFLALKAEALHLADRSSEALEAIEKAEALAERSGRRDWCAEIHRLRGVFLTAMGAEETQIEGSFCKAIRVAKEQKSVSLGTRAEATYAEYCRQKATAPKGVDCGYLFAKTPKKGNAQNRKKFVTLGIILRDSLVDILRDRQTVRDA